MDTPSHIDRLFRLALGDFTTARNALVASLRKTGQNAEAERVNSFQKPSIPAWVVNQLYWRHRKAFDRLIAGGDRFRVAQASTLAGRPQDIRGPFEARRKALLHLTELATRLLRNAGHRTTPDMLRRVTKTLEALSTFGSHPGAPPAGRLTDDVDPPGFEALAALVPRMDQAERLDHTSQVIPFRQAHRGMRGNPEEQARALEAKRKAARAAAQARVADCERALRAARTAGRQAEAALKKAATRAKFAERRKVVAETRFQQVASATSAAHVDARRIAAAAEEAAQAIEDAERALAQAKRDVTNVTS